jgi:vacuolar-type H+-ATPase subunit I/STV1
MEYVEYEQNNQHNNKQDIKKIITAIKYLKKIIPRLSKESFTDEEKQKLFVQYEDLVEIIVTDCRSMSIEFS